MLIKAPIWFGKSFLFFDGPIYGLYKYSARGILNSKSKEGYIKILVEVNKNHYLIIRNIKKGKVRESCESQLYSLDWDLPNFNERTPIENDIDIEDLIKEYSGLKRDEITFKNETDLQQNLQTFLPPREVIMNTIFLMQDSDNIFELTPVERLTILKNVFNLLGIDEAKDIIADKKREVRYKIKSKTDISSYNQKLKNNMQNYLKTFDISKELLKEKIDMSLYEEFFNERKTIEEKIQITDFSLEDFPHEREQQLQAYIEDKKIETQKIEHQLETIQKDITWEQIRIKEQEKEEHEISNTISTLQKKIESSDEKKIETLKQQKQYILNKQTTHENSLPKQKILTFIQEQWSETTIFDEEDLTIPSTYILIQHYINEGKKYNEEIKNIQLQIQNEELIQKNEEEKRTTQTKHIEEKILDQKNQFKNLEKTLEELEKNIETQAKYDCDRIKEPCPFIKFINKKTFDQLEGQKKTFLDQKDTIEKIITTREEERKNIPKSISKENNETKKQLEQKSMQAEQKIHSIKKFLNEINYKDIENSYTKYNNQDKEIRNLDKEINDKEQEAKQAEERKVQLQKAMIQKENSQKQLKEWIQTISKKEETWKKLKTEKAKADTKTIMELEHNHNSMKQHHHDMKTVVDEFKQHQLETQQLKEQETILGNLYNIFSKELLLVVLQDHLPVLNDIINTYLAQIVDYQINLQLNKSNWEKLELEAKIIDSKGERDTKSLSWGQKIILKLIWMLAISSYINSPILFLDETINNLDADTVGKVANMLEDFVKQREMKFYTITHSQQIQEMDIRDEIIEINE